MNQISLRFSSVCRSSSLLRNNLFTRSSKRIRSSSLISNNNTSSSSNLITPFISKFHHHAFNYPTPPQIPTICFGKFSGEAAHNFGDDDYLKKEIMDIQMELWDAHGNVETGDGLDAVEVLANKFHAFMEKLGLDTLDDNEKEDSGDDDYLFLISHHGEFPDHLKGFKKDIEYVRRYADMTVAFVEFVAAGGEPSWYPFMSHYRRMLRGETNEEYGIFEEGKDENADEKYRKILRSLRQMNIRSRLMKRLLKAKSDSQSIVA